MKCKIIQDLLPLYCDKLTSKESNEEIEIHLQDCAECMEIYETMKNAPADIPVDRNLQPLKKVKLWYHRRVLLILLLLLGLLVLFFYLHKKFCLDPRLCYQDEVSYSYSVSKPTQMYCFINESGQQETLIIEYDAEFVIDEIANRVYYDGKEAFSEMDGSPIPADGTLVPFGHITVHFNVDSWTGWYMMDCQIERNRNYGFGLDENTPNNSRVKFYPAVRSPMIAAYANCYLPDEQGFSYTYESPSCADGRMLILECKDGDIIIDLHQIALEHGIIAE